MPGQRVTPIGRRQRAIDLVRRHPRGVHPADHRTHARAGDVVDTKESGPPETIKTFGEVYAFSPDVFAVRRDQPTQVIFWNLQADDEHDFMLTDPANHVLFETRFAPRSKTTYVMTFHDPGIFPFYCKMHQPAMSGEIIVTSQ